MVYFHPKIRLTITMWLVICGLVAGWAIGAGSSCLAQDAAQTDDAPLVVQSDTGVRGGAVALEALPNRTSTNTLKKVFTVDSLEGVKSAELLIYGALRDPTEQLHGFSFASWEWIFFDLNGYEWVRRVEDLPMHRRSLFAVEWRDVTWIAIPIPEISYLREGVNELIIWNNNLPENRKDKYLVIAYDDSGRSTNSFSLVGDEWVSEDLNGERDEAPVGEWMIRLKLNRYPLPEQKRRDAVGAARFQEALEAKKAFVCGFTDALHKIFPDVPYDGPLGNEWRIEAARNEYESCQLIVIPVATDLSMVDVSVAPFKSKDGAKIPAEAVTVRLVKTATVNNRQWPDPLPPVAPVDIARGRVQAFWITVHVPEECDPGQYEAVVRVFAASGADNYGAEEELKLALQVYDFALPTLSRYQMVGGAAYHYQIVPKSAHGFWPAPRYYLDRDERMQLDFTDFDRQMEEALERGVTEFSIGRAFTGAGNFAPWTFDDRVEVEGQSEPRRIWWCPVQPHAGDNPEQARQWFVQFFTQYYRHLEEKGWTQYFYVYGADEPHREEWTEPLTEYFALIKQIAPKLRIMVTSGPTQRFGPTVDIWCIMMNHLRAGTAAAAEELGAELWCYSCGDLNNPALTIPHAPITVRLWPWLHEKWDVERALLWNTGVYDSNYDRAGADSRGDGQIFWRGNIGGREVRYPSIRAEMLRDGIEDREYLRLLKELTEKFAPQAESASEQRLLVQARALAEIPDEIVKTQFEMTRDISLVLEHRSEIARTIERLARRLGYAQRPLQRGGL